MDKVIEDVKQGIVTASSIGAANEAKNNYYKNTMMYGFGLAGNVAGILLAVHRKSGFWGGVGWFLIGGLAGSATGFVIGSILDGKPKAE